VLVIARRILGVAIGLASATAQAVFEERVAAKAPLAPEPAAGT
jgi:hypothetical protein